MKQTDDQTQKTTEAREALQGLAEEARERQMEDAPQNHPRPLVGHCFSNALAAYREFNRAGYNPSLVVGTHWRMLSNMGQVDPEEFECVEDVGSMRHYWVEVQGDDGVDYVVDIAANTQSREPGMLYVEPDLPDDYYRFEDSYEVGQNIIERNMDQD